MPEPITDELISDLLSDAANLAVVMAGLPDGNIPYGEVAAEVAAALRNRGLGTDVVATIASKFIACVARTKAAIEAAAGTNPVRIQ